MRLGYIGSALSLILRDIGFVTFIPILVALYYHDWNSVLPFLAAGAFALFLSLFFKYIIKGLSDVDVNSLNDIKRSEALMIVSTSWILFALVVAIPYLFYDLSFVDSLFESVSGITTTGATIFQTYNYPKVVLFWRSFSQWLGGMGIIVLFVAILPQFAVAGRQMFFAEAPGPTEDKITPRIKNTASALWIVYAGMTVICAICLWLAGMNPFDCICNAMSTLAAGGFSPNPLSIAGYGSNLINWIIIIFMFIAGSSFALQSRALTKRKLSLFWKSEEFRCYVCIILIFSLVLGGILFFEQHYSLFHSVTASVYQILTLSTSTGSASEDFQLWSFNAKIVLILAMFISSCSGSAGGGVKITRWILIFKYINNELYKILHPNAVKTIKIDNMVVAPEVIRQTIFFMICFMLIFAIVSVAITFIEQNATLGIVASISSLGDIGPGLTKATGPMASFAAIHSSSKCLMIFNMLIGRLEIIPFLILFNKDFWLIKR